MSEWIPVTKRKPERSQRVLAKFRYGRAGVWTEHTAISTATYIDHGVWYIDLMQGTDNSIAEVIGWMLLPGEEPEPARWLQRKRNGYAVLVCSACEREKEGYVRTAYCPHCGRPMTEEAAGCE